MFAHRVEIDGDDLWTEYCMYIAKGGRLGLMQYPPLKNVYTNEWAEEDGLDCDLSAPRLDSKEFDIKLNIDDREYGQAAVLYDDFVHNVCDGKYHDWYFADLQKFFRLRFVSHSNIKIMNQPKSGYGNLTAQTGMLLSLKFADDFPLFQYTYQRPNIEEPFYRRYKSIDSASKIDSMYFYEYGAVLLEGSLLEVYKTPEMKTALIQNISSGTGRQMLSQFGTHKGKQAKITLLMTAPGMQDLLRSYYALLWRITQPDAHTLIVKRGDGVLIQHDVYYKSSVVKKFYTENTPSIIFSITFQVID